MADGARDRRGLLVLATGHVWADFLQGAVPALLPFLIAERGYSYAAAGALVLASGITLGAAIGVGGLAAAALGALADATSLQTTMWTIAVLPLPALLIALTLPPTDTDRRLRAAARATEPADLTEASRPALT